MDFDSSTPIYLQVITAIKQDIVTGRMPLGTKLPSGRDLAVQYTINPNTASRVYKELEAEGICFTRRGLGTFVTENEDLIRKLREEMAAALLLRFLDGMKQIGYTPMETKEALERYIAEQSVN